ncbi:oligoribonuclease [Vibrio fluvialis]|nr:oligoribonuclease [Vibrio fluvialis]
MEIKEFDFSQLQAQLTLSIAEPRQDVVFLWADMETGGLNGRLENGELGSEYYPIFEMAFKLTDRALNEITEPLRVVVYQSEEMIERSSVWALEKHEETGLLKEVRENGVELYSAETMILEWLVSVGVGPYDRKAQTGAVLAGNGIHFDRSFITAQLPRLNQYLYYRQMDVSAINIACLAWRPDMYEEVRQAKEYRHEAMADINESIDEAHVYKQHIERGIDM